MFTSYGLGQYSGSAAANEAHVLFTPWGYRSDGTKRPILWMHSAGGLALEPDIVADNCWPLLEALVSALRLPCISFDASPPSGATAQHWGNDTARSRTTDALAYIGSRLNAKTDKAILLGVSMGALLALNWARANPTKVAGLALLYPAVNLQAMHDGTGGIVGNATASTEAAYGGSLAAFNAAVASHDPAQNTSAIAALGAPMKMWYSSADTVAGTANQTAFAAAVGSALSTRSLGAVGHADMTQISGVELQKFIAACA